MKAADAGSLERWRDTSTTTTGQTKILPVSYERQILPGTFEHTLSYVIDNKIDLTIFEDRYQNDDGGAPAYDPAIPLEFTYLLMQSLERPRGRSDTKIRSQGAYSRGRAPVPHPKIRAEGAEAHAFGPSCCS
ncbi:MAG TPA: hypothetical protein VK629_11690 [Steroidobacteraceae bacterium]|nr:hypothetical protein [Steroidobacteraceae bacterium]